MGVENRSEKRVVRHYYTNKMVYPRTSISSQHTGSPTTHTQFSSRYMPVSYSPHMLVYITPHHGWRGYLQPIALLVTPEHSRRHERQVHEGPTPETGKGLLEELGQLLGECDEVVDDGEGEVEDRVVVGWAVAVVGAEEVGGGWEAGREVSGSWVVFRDCHCVRGVMSSGQAGKEILRHAVDGLLLYEGGGRVGWAVYMGGYWKWSVLSLGSGG